MTSLKQLFDAQLKDPEFVREYQALEDEFSLATALISARRQAKMTQSDVADKMQTSQSYIAKLEGGRVSPTLRALQRYAKATHTHLKLTFEPRAREALTLPQAQAAPSEGGEQVGARTDPFVPSAANR